MKPTSAPPILLLSRDRISELAGPGDYFECMRTTFSHIAAGSFETTEVGHISGAEGAFHLKAARNMLGRPLAAIKVNGNFPHNGVRYGLPTIQGFLALLDAERGNVLAFMDSIEITARRTAATTALAAHYLAVSWAHTLGIVGCGVQARYHLEALADVFPLRSVLFCDPRDVAVELFEAHLRRHAGLRWQRVSEPGEVCRGAQIVVTLTTSTQPVLHLQDVASGTLVAAVGADNPHKRELAGDLLHASRVVVDSLPQAATMGDLHHAIAGGTVTAQDVHGELAQLAAGRLAGRKDENERWVFDSTGLGSQDLAAAIMLYDRAKTSGCDPDVHL